MLIGFSTANFLSIRDRQTLSMAAASARDQHHRYSFHTGSRSTPRLLRAAAIYGPNAAGKSNLGEALDFMRDFVINSAKSRQEGQKIPVIPFKLSKETRHSPSEFEIVFIKNGNRYQYGFTVDQNRVWEEWLFSVPKGGRTQQWLERIFDNESGSYQWYINPRLKGERSVWQKSTRDNALLLSTAVLLNANVFKEIFDWFQSTLHVIHSSQRISPDFTVAMCDTEKTKSDIISFMQSADINITDILLRESNFSHDMLPHDIPDSIKKEIVETLADNKLIDVQFAHDDDDGEQQYFSLHEESDGSQVIFSLAGPWLDVIENGLVLFVDELHNSLHPRLFHHLVEIIMNGEVNRKNAQIIFTTHDTSLMSSHLLRRDQIWLIEKDQKEGSVLLPISEFKPRRQEAIEQAYLGGRYGALPNIRHLTSDFSRER